MRLQLLVLENNPDDFEDGWKPELQKFSRATKTPLDVLWHIRPMDLWEATPRWGVFPANAFERLEWWHFSATDEAPTMEKAPNELVRFSAFDRILLDNNMAQNKEDIDIQLPRLGKVLWADLGEHYRAHIRKDPSVPNDPDLIYIWSSFALKVPLDEAGPVGAKRSNDLLEDMIRWHRQRFPDPLDRMIVWFAPGTSEQLATATREAIQASGHSERCIEWRRDLSPEMLHGAKAIVIVASMLNDTLKALLLKWAGCLACAIVLLFEKRVGSLRELEDSNIHIYGLPYADSIAKLSSILRCLARNPTLVGPCDGNSRIHRVLEQMHSANRRGGDVVITGLRGVGKRTLQKRLEHSLRLPDPLKGEAIKLPSACTSDFIAESEKSRSVLRQANMHAPHSEPVLICGEPGTGKSRLARVIHDTSNRTGLWLHCDCGRLTQEELAQSELFGHEKGAFTGANAQHRGFFEQAAEGTVFLDNIDKLPLGVQKLLHALWDTRVFRRMKGTDDIQLRCRLLFATSVDLQNLVNAGTFWPDLQDRLKANVIIIPPLNDRRDDIPALLRRFLDEAAGNPDFRGCPSMLSTEAAKAICRTDWPRNVRDLRDSVFECLRRARGSAELGLQHVDAEIVDRLITLKAELFEHYGFEEGARKASQLKSGSSGRRLIVLLEQGGHENLRGSVHDAFPSAHILAIPSFLERSEAERMEIVRYRLRGGNNDVIVYGRDRSPSALNDVLVEIDAEALSILISKDWEANIAELNATIDNLIMSARRRHGPLLLITAIDVHAVLPTGRESDSGIKNSDESFNKEAVILHRGPEAELREAELEDVIMRSTADACDHYCVRIAGLIDKMLDDRFPQAVKERQEKDTKRAFLKASGGNCFRRLETLILDIGGTCLSYYDTRIALYALYLSINSNTSNMRPEKNGPRSVINVFQHILRLDLNPKWLSDWSTAPKITVLLERYSKRLRELVGWAHSVFRACDPETKSRIRDRIESLGGKAPGT